MDDKRKSIAVVAGSGMSLAAAAATVMAASVASEPWGSVPLSRGWPSIHDFGFAPDPRFHGRMRASGGNKKWPSGDTERKAKRKAQKRARATTRKHRKHD